MGQGTSWRMRLRSKLCMPCHRAVALGLSQSLAALSDTRQHWSESTFKYVSVSFAGCSCKNAPHTPRDPQCDYAIYTKLHTILQLLAAARQPPGSNLTVRVHHHHQSDTVDSATGAGSLAMARIFATGIRYYCEGSPAFTHNLSHKSLPVKFQHTSGTAPVARALTPNRFLAWMVDILGDPRISAN
jgi:hypothetical protein